MPECLDTIVWLISNIMHRHSSTFYIGQATGWHITKGIGGCGQLLLYQYKIGVISQKH